MALLTKKQSEIEFCNGCGQIGCAAWKEWGVGNVYEAVPEDKQEAVGAGFTVRRDILGYCEKLGHDMPHPSTKKSIS